MLDQPSNIETGWTEERVSALKSLWMDGLSASQIAAELGGGLTRSAVIGKVHRLKLSARAQSQTKAQKSAAGRAYVAASRRPNGRGQTKAAAIVHRRSTAPAFETAPLPEEELGNDVTRFTLLEASDNKGCMYCNGDPLTAIHSFCNKPRKPGTPWCDHHYGIVYKAVPA